MSGGEKTFSFPFSVRRTHSQFEFGNPLFQQRSPNEKTEWKKKPPVSGRESRWKYTKALKKRDEKRRGIVRWKRLRWENFHFNLPLFSPFFVCYDLRNSHTGFVWGWLSSFPTFSKIPFRLPTFWEPSLLHILYSHTGEQNSPSLNDQAIYYLNGRPTDLLAYPCANIDSGLFFRG